MFAVAMLSSCATNEYLAEEAQCSAQGIKNFPAIPATKKYRLPEQLQYLLAPKNAREGRLVVIGKLNARMKPELNLKTITST